MLSDTCDLFPSRRRSQTLQGPIAASKLGFTLPHEHICVSARGFWQAWPEFFGGRASYGWASILTLLSTELRSI
jgi:predicted metal-dependent phosphotriesterase family hydrolase